MFAHFEACGPRDRHHIPSFVGPVELRRLASIELRHLVFTGSVSSILIYMWIPIHPHSVLRPMLLQNMKLIHQWQGGLYHHGDTITMVSPWHKAYTCCTYPADTRRWPDAGLMLGQRRRRWPNIKPALGQWWVYPYSARNIIMTLILFL